MGKLKTANEKLDSLGMTASALKLLALLAMLIDHIAYFGDGLSGGFPVWMRIVGRLAYPIFAFFVVEGFQHTHDLKRYFIRLYAISVCMGMINLLCYHFRPRADAFYPENNIMGTFALLLVILWAIRLIERKEKWYIGAGVLAGIAALNIVYELLLTRYWIATMLTKTVLPLPTTVEGGLYWLGMGLIFYLLRANRKRQLWGFVIYCIVAYAAQMAVELVGLGVTLDAVLYNWKNFFRYYYSWMACFAAPLLAYYNGKRGEKNQSYFYWFYPAHVYLLYAASCFLI